MGALTVDNERGWDDFVESTGNPETLLQPSPGRGTNAEKRRFMHSSLPRVQIREHVCIWPQATSINPASRQVEPRGGPLATQVRGRAVPFPGPLAAWPPARQRGIFVADETLHVPRRSRPSSRNIRPIPVNTPSAHDRLMPERRRTEDKGTLSIEWFLILTFRADAPRRQRAAAAAASERGIGLYIFRSP